MGISALPSPVGLALAEGTLQLVVGEPGDPCVSFWLSKPTVSEESGESLALFGVDG